MHRVSIIGASGYSGMELSRILLAHPTSRWSRRAATSFRPPDRKSRDDDRRGRLQRPSLLTKPRRLPRTATSRFSRRRPKCRSSSRRSCSRAVGASSTCRARFACASALLSEVLQLRASPAEAARRGRLWLARARSRRASATRGSSRTRAATRPRSSSRLRRLPLSKAARSSTRCRAYRRGPQGDRGLQLRRDRERRPRVSRARASAHARRSSSSSARASRSCRICCRSSAASSRRVMSSCAGRGTAASTSRATRRAVHLARAVGERRQAASTSSARTSAASADAAGRRASSSSSARSTTSSKAPPVRRFRT